MVKEPKIGLENITVSFVLLPGGVRSSQLHQVVGYSFKF